MFHPKSPLVVAILLVVVSSPLLGEETENVKIPPSKPAEIKIFMRVSKDLFEELTQDVVEMEFPFRKCVEGMAISGLATGQGTTSVQLETLNDQAEFVVSITGTASATMKADIGPAIARLTSRAQFTSRKRFRFDGVDYSSQSAETTSKNVTQVNRICAKKRGPMGRIIEKVARKIANRELPALNRAAEKFSEEMLSLKFDELATELIDELNQTTQFDELVAEYFPETKDWKYRLGTADDSILVGVGPSDAQFAPWLLAEDKKLDAMMEFWLPLTAGQAILLEMVVDLETIQDLLSDFLAEEDAREIAADVKMVRRGEWSVIQVGLPKTEAAP